MSTGIGETLRAARRRLGHSLGDAAADTRVRETYLAALEEEDFATLGGDVYVKGFLRSYARFLDLDPEPLLATYRRDHERPEDPPPVRAAPVAPLSREWPSPMVMGGLALGGLLLILALVGLFSGGDDADVPVVGPSPADPQASIVTAGTLDPGAVAAEPTASVDPTPTVTASASVNEDGVRILSVPVSGDEIAVEIAVDGGESYLEVSADGEDVYTGQPGDGFSETYTGSDEVVVLIGNADPVQLVANGQDQGDLGDPGEVVEYTFRLEEA